MRLNVVPEFSLNTGWSEFVDKIWRFVRKGALSMGTLIAPQPEAMLKHSSNPMTFGATN